MMTREEAIKRTHAFQLELDALAKKYEIYTYAFTSFMHAGDTSGYPVCAYWKDKRSGIEKHADVTAKVFHLGYAAIKGCLGTATIHEYRAGFGRPKPDDQ